jgi:hypothetical protein
LRKKTVKSVGFDTFSSKSILESEISGIPKKTVPHGVASLNSQFKGGQQIYPEIFKKFFNLVM